MATQPLDLSTSLGLDARFGRSFRDNERLVLFALVFVVATVPYFFINLATAHRVAATLETPLDALIPLQKGWEYAYIGFDLFVFFPFTVVRDPKLLRRAVTALASTYGAAYVVFLAYPVQMVRYVDRSGTSFLDWGIRLNHALDAPFNCFPSLHCAISTVVALTALKADRRVGVFASLYAASIVVSTLTLKQHYILDAAAGVALAVVICRWQLAPWKPEGAPAFPRRLALVIPSLYAVGLLLAFLAYRAGVPVPRADWDHLEVDLSAAR